MATDYSQYSNPDFELQRQQLNRQQKMAEALLASGQQMAQGPAGQMVSGRYVQNSPLQMLNGPINQLVGAYLSTKGDEKATALAEKLRGQEMADIQQYMDTYKGRAASPEIRTELAGPYGANMGEGMNVPRPEAVIPARAAVQANPDLANMNAASSYSPILRQMGLKRMTDGPKWNEVSKYNEKTGNTETYVYDQNSPNPESTMRYVSTSKPALDPYQQIRLGDEGIGTGRFGGGTNGSMPVQNAPVVGGGMPTGNMPVNPIQPPVVGGSVVKPVSATNAPVDALVTTYGYDPFKPPQMPAMPSGSAARSWKADIYKPLEGTPANTVTGATTYVDALGKYNDYITGLSAKDLANPQVRTKLTSLYSQVKLTGKEANNLGVLNGGDEKILEAVVPNYSDILVTKNTVKKILDEQKEFGSSKIVATYRTAQKPVPENMRKYVVVPKVEEAPTSTPKQTGATARAVLNGEQIEVRGGKWVNSRTGQEVK
jgi:hypothetical protein